MGGRNSSAAAATPIAVAMMKGCSTIFLTTPMTSLAGERGRPPESAIIIGAMAKCMMFSKQKINATGTAACSPSANRAIPGPI